MAAAVLAPVRECTAQNLAPRESRQRPAAVEIRAGTPGPGLLHIDVEAVKAARATRTAVLLKDVRLDQATVDLRLEPFSVTTAETRFVLGRPDGSDVPLAYDPADIVLLRGTVDGRPGSSAFVALSERGGAGRVVLNSGGDVYWMSSRSADGRNRPPGQFSLFRAGGPSSAPLPPVALCGTDSAFTDLHAAPRQAAGLGTDPGAVPPIAQQLQLAVDTDYEFFTLFGDATAAADYIVELFAAVSDIYFREVNTRVVLTFVRVWDTPNDLFNGPDPLPEFRTHWQANMGSVVRDTAQLCSGRRDYPFGGQAYLDALCGAFGYGVVGYMLGFFPDPAHPSPYHYDIEVTAHELGHNCGTPHTHDLGLDTCDDPAGTPQRGSIMSYCSQTWSGGNSLDDFYFHTAVRAEMVPEIFGKPCVADDCNLNDVPDASDISGGGSLDANSNGVPDECEDCNRNNVLDDADILGASQDLNANGVPDECEPDCNGNNVPDDQDIAQGSDTDLYGNGVPDGCETDCDGSTVSDYNEIQADLSVDLDRNAVLDVCQDCDGNGTNDVAALGGAHDLWIASGVDPAPLRRFHAAVGSLTATGGGGPAGVVRGGQDVLTLPDQRVLVSSFADDRVLAFGDDGAFLGDFVAPGSGGLDGPTGLALSPAGSVLVASYNNNRVLAYNAKTGAPLGAFVAPGAGGLVKPFGLTFRPGGDLYIAGGDNRVRQYNRNSGSFVRVLVPASSGGLFDPRGLTFKPDGHLVVTSNASDQVLEYEGATGLFIGAFTHVGTGTVLNQTSPWGVRVGPNGSLYVSRTGEPGGDGDGHDHDHGGGGELHLSNAQVYEFDIATGNFLRVLVGGNDHGLIFPTGFDFVPGWAADCNLNLLQDDCDIAAGTSADADADGIPDECQVDCNSNGIQDRLDVIPYGEDLDCNYNLRPDPCDIAADPALDVNANGLIDGCECVSAGSCADADHDGRRDDGCLWWSCQTGTCNSLAVTFADVGGVFGDCHPDGVVDGNDRFHALDCFANVSAEGTMPYPCEAAAPRAYNVDAGGMFGNCVPDGVCDGHDVFHVLSVFEGISLCSCGGAAPAAAPPGGAQKKRPPPILPEAVLQLRASRNRLTAGQNVAVDVRLGSAVPDLRAFQLHLGVSGGTSGSLELVDIFIREPSVFSPAAKESDLAPRAPRYERGAASDERRAVSDERPSLNPPSFWSAFNTSTHQVLAGVDGPGVAVPAGAYLATFVFQATRDAAGTFAVEILADTADPAQRTFLFTSPTAAPRAVAPPAPALVTVESRDMQTFSP